MTHSNKYEQAELHELFLYQLSEVIYLEHKLYSTFQEVTRQVNCIDLKMAMREHEIEIASQHARLKEIAFLLDTPEPEQTEWPVFNLFADELKAIIAAHEQPKVRDFVLIAFARKVKAYEIACYQNLKYLASLMNMESIHQLLLESFDEKEETKTLLDELSKECYKNPVMYPDLSS